MYLIDTHIIIWTLYNQAMLSQKAKDIMDNEECCFSIASLWEMAIKKGLKKIDFDQSLKQIADILLNGGIKVRNITPDDCDIVKNLPFIHKDPFDRIIIAQAISDNMPILTKDEIIPKYDVQTVWK